MAAAAEVRPADAGWRDPAASRSRPSAAVGLAAERRRWSVLGLPEGVQDTLQSARAPSTRATYRNMWQGFCAWCEGRRCSPEDCSPGEVLCFLQSLLDSGRTASTLKVYLAAITANHAGTAEGPLSRLPLLSRFMKKVRRLRPVRPPIVPRWDLGLVLDALSQPPFELGGCPIETSV